VLRNFDCSLEFVFSLLLLHPFKFSPVSFTCNLQDWGCVILREIDILLKICWSIPCLHPSWKVHISSNVWFLFMNVISAFISKAPKGSFCFCLIVEAVFVFFCCLDKFWIRWKEGTILLPRDKKPGASTIGSSTCRLLGLVQERDEGSVEIRQWTLPLHSASSANWQKIYYFCGCVVMGRATYQQLVRLRICQDRWSVGVELRRRWFYIKGDLTKIKGR